MHAITQITHRNIFTPEGIYVRLGYKISLPFCGYAYFLLMYFLEVAVC